MVASRNRKKLAELSRVLERAGVLGLQPVSLDDVPSYPESPETGATFEENALVKARDGYSATGLPCVADDSGLTVAALNGMPGVLSARWSGSHGDDAANTALLLAQLCDVPDDRRSAAFVSACALVWGSGPQCEVVVRGEWAATSPANPAATEDSVTTRCSSRRAATAPPRSSPRKRRTPRRTGAEHWNCSCLRCGS